MRTQRDLIHEITDMIIDHNAGVENHEEGLHWNFYSYIQTDDGKTEPVNAVTCNGYSDAHKRQIPWAYIDLHTATIEELEAAKQKIGNFITLYNLDHIKPQEPEKTPEEAENV